MSYYTIDKSRENDPHALADVEIFKADHGDEGMRYWYQYGFPGCMHESDPVGPFDTEQEALAAAREDAGYCPHGVADDGICEECPTPKRCVCGETWPCTDSRRKDLRPDVRAAHYCTSR